MERIITVNRYSHYKNLWHNIIMEKTIRKVNFFVQFGEQDHLQIHDQVGTAFFEMV